MKALGRIGIDLAVIKNIINPDLKNSEIPRESKMTEGAIAERLTENLNIVRNLDIITEEEKNEILQVAYSAIEIGKKTPKMEPYQDFLTNQAQIIKNALAKTSNAQA